MSRGSTRRTEEPSNRREPGHTAGARSADIQSFTRKYGAFNALAGLIGLVGPLVLGNDDDGLVNTESGRFLGLVAVNGPHALLHAGHGLHGVFASRDPESARRYLRLSAAFFAIFAAVGWKRFGVEPGVHSIAGLAVDRWGNLGHTALSGIGLAALRRADSES